MINSSTVAVNSSDTITVNAQIVAGDSGGEGDEWEVVTSSSGGQDDSVVAYTTGSANPAMEYAIVGILEAQTVKACDGLPSEAAIYSLTQLTQEQTGSDGWYYWVNVLGSVTYSGNPGQPGGPSCDYEGYMNPTEDGVYYPVVTWNIYP